MAQALTKIAGGVTFVNGVASTASDLGQRLCHGVLLPNDVHVAEVAKEGVGEHVQQQTGTRRADHLDQIPGAAKLCIRDRPDGRRSW